MQTKWTFRLHKTAIQAKTAMLCELYILHKELAKIAQIAPFCLNCTFFLSFFCSLCNMHMVGLFYSFYTLFIALKV